MSVTRVAIVCDARGRILQDFSDPPLPGGSSLPDLVPPADRSRAHAFLDDLRASHPVFDRDLRLRAAEEALHFAGGQVGERLLVVGTPSREELGPLFESLTASARREPLSSETIAREQLRVQNELLASHRELVRRRRELERIDAERTRILGVLAHDMRNSLNLVLGFVGLLDEGEEELTPEERREFVARALDAGHLMTRLLDDLIDYSTVEAGRLELRLEESDLGTLVARSVEANRLLARKSGVHLEAAVGPTVPVRLDPQRIEQVLNNLLSNAIKFSPQGTTVTIRAKTDAHEAVVSVEDHGPGIPAAELTRLFQPFGTTSARPPRSSASTGLGLAISRDIVEAHGGKIHVASREGEGSTFTFSVPLGGPPAPGPGGKPLASTAPA